jgi:hypothetical protein
VLGPIVHLVWLAFPNSHLQTKAIFRWSYSLRVLLWVRPVWNLLAVICRVLRVADSSLAVPRSVNSRLAPFQHMHRRESKRPFPPPFEHKFLRMAEVFWSPLLVTPILFSCFDVELLLGSASSVSEVAVLQTLSFEPLLTFSFETKSLVVLPPFCFSPNLDFLLLNRYLN